MVFANFEDFESKFVISWLQKKKKIKKEFTELKYHSINFKSQIYIYQHNQLRS